MIQRPIYEYPKELLWHPKSMKWYLENDPNGLHKELADTLLQIRKEGVNISNIEQVLNDAYCIAVIVATTEGSKYTDLSIKLFDKYPDNIVLLCGCVILLSHKNYEEYKYTAEEIINNIWEDFGYDVPKETKLKYQSIKNRIINSHKTGLQIDLSPDAFVETEMTINWLKKNMSLRELETIIKFHRTKKNQLDFLNGIIYKYFVEDILPI